MLGSANSVAGPGVAACTVGKTSVPVCVGIDHSNNDLCSWPGHNNFHLLDSLPTRPCANRPTKSFTAFSQHLWDRWHPHFIDQETKARRGEKLAQGHKAKR